MKKYLILSTYSNTSAILTGEKELYNHIISLGDIENLENNNVTFTDTSTATIYEISEELIGDSILDTATQERTKAISAIDTLKDSGIEITKDQSTVLKNRFAFLKKT